MEDELDAIARGEVEAVPWLHDFYFGISDGRQRAPPDHAHGAPCPGRHRRRHRTARGLADHHRPDARGRKGRGERSVVTDPYIQVGDSEQSAHPIPDDLPPDELSLNRALEMIAKAAEGDRAIGNDPETGKARLHQGGPLRSLRPARRPRRRRRQAQDGQPLEEHVARNRDPRATAMMLLSFPKDLGKHPESGEAITVQDGRYGPYVKMGKETRSLDNQEQLATITLDEAVAKLKEPKKGRRSRRRRGDRRSRRPPRIR